MFSRRHQQHPNPPALAWPASPRTSGLRGAIRSWAVALGSAAAIGLLAGPAGATTASWQVVQGPVVPSGEFLAVAGLGPADVWAVGDHFTTAQGYKTLTEHWDGTAWTVVPSPGPGNWNMLRAVAPVTANDVWAVGFTKSYGTLVLHWNGRAWTQVSSSAFGAGRPLYGVAAFGANDVWAVGSNGSAAFVVHFDGTSWQEVAAPISGRPASLYKVAGSGPNDIWAVGDAYGATDATVMLHWNGSNWAQVAAPHPGASDYIRGLSVRSASDAWFVGEWDGPGPGYTPHPFIGRWNGTAWTQVSSPAGQTLYGVATGSATDGWIVGNNGSPSTTFASMLEHWDGTTWSVSPSPVPGPGESELTGITALPDGTFWAVGARQQPNGTFTPLTLRHAPG